MGASQGNRNAAKARTRVQVCLSISDEKKKPQRLSWVIEQLQAKKIEPTDEEVNRFVKELCYQHIDELTSKGKS